MSPKFFLFLYFFVSGIFELKEKSICWLWQVIFLLFFIYINIYIYIYIYMVDRYRDRGEESESV
jgi:hypothetical protein